MGLTFSSDLEEAMFDTGESLSPNKFKFCFLENPKVYINDCNVDLEKIPASSVRQLVKRMESSKAAAKHIKQVASDPEAAQINLMRH